MKREVLYHTTKPYHAPRRGSAFASPSNGSAATSPASIIVRAYESWADDENQCFVVTSTFASRKGGKLNSPFGASTKSVVVPVWEGHEDAIAATAASSRSMTTPSQHRTRSPASGRCRACSTRRATRRLF